MMLSAKCSCGYRSREKPAKLREEIKKTSAKIEVLADEAETLPVTKADCPKCGSEEAYYWMQQTRAADEGETKFLKCKKCGHTWRDYS